MRYYYPPALGADLSKGFETFEKLDDGRDEHLESLLKTIIDHERKQGKRVEADFITWRGMMTKVGVDVERRLRWENGADGGSLWRLFSVIGMGRLMSLEEELL